MENFTFNAEIAMRRQIDPHGRITIPKPFREIFHIATGAKYMVYADADGRMMLEPIKEETK